MTRHPEAARIRLTAVSSETLAQDLQNAKRALALELGGLAALQNSLDADLGVQLSRVIDLLYRSSGRLIVTGIGKSGHIGRKLAATFASTGTSAHFVHPADASHGDLGMIRNEDVVMALSWSGESSELSDIVAYTRRYSVPLVAVTACAQSTLSAAADIALILPDVSEACPNGLAPTTSTTMQLVLGDMLAICLLQRRHFSPRDFRQFHPGGKLAARLRQVRELMHGAPDIPLVGQECLLSQAIYEMTAKGFGVTGVTDAADKLIGVVTDGDLRRALEGGFYDRPAREVMSRSPRTIAAGVLAEQALSRLNQEKITSLFVIEDGKPIGIITVHDLLRAGIS
jgi:arabinose-5-phosphate isomerase